MNLSDIITDAPLDEELWIGKYKIPWDDPDFSRRMLAVHLSQTDDLASRTIKKIEDHITWISRHLLRKKHARVLDLACGPGLYSHRLAELGHECHGIDFSPASIEHATSHSPSTTGSCHFTLGDLRAAEFGKEYDTALMIYGEFNAFPRHEALAILKKVHAALRPGGKLLIEAHTGDEIERIGKAPNSWYKTPAGLFSDHPHICLIETSWHEEERTAEAVFFVIDAGSATVDRYRNTLLKYSDDDYGALLHEAGFAEVDLLPSWDNEKRSAEDSFLLIKAKK